MKIKCIYKEDKNHWSWKYNLYFRLNVTELVLNRLESDCCLQLCSLCHWIIHKISACGEIARKSWKAEDATIIPKCVSVVLGYFSTGTVDMGEACDCVQPGLCKDSGNGPFWVTEVNCCLWCMMRYRYSCAARREDAPSSYKIALLIKMKLFQISFHYTRIRRH